jgi:hypothetical protein
VDLGRGEPDALRVLHGLDHVLDQPAHLARGRVGDLLGAADEDGVAHAGDLQEGHVAEFLMIRP